MGQRLIEYYEKARAMGGIKAQMRLAMMTRVPSDAAVHEQDSSENIRKFEDAIKELQKEFAK
jgi:tellurite resistance protein